MRIKNIILVMEGVLLDINEDAMVEAFKKLGALNFSSISRTKDSLQLITKFQNRVVTATDFREQFKNLLDIDVSDADFDWAWNSKFLSIPSDRADLLKGLKDNYSLFLFSDVDEIRFNGAKKIMEQTSGVRGSFHTECYFCRKKLYVSNSHYYRHVLRELNLVPEETVFVGYEVAENDIAEAAGSYVIQLGNDKSILNLTSYIQELKKQKTPQDLGEEDTTLMSCLFQ